MSDIVILHSKDDVGIALRPLSAGEHAIGILNGKEHAIELTEDVPKGHKVSLRRIEAGNHVFKFGYSIGLAKEAILPGTWIHTHNLKTGLSGEVEYQYKPNANQGLEPSAASHGSSTFQGYVRSNGEVGIRNEIWIINTVGCINKTCELLARMAGQQFQGRGIDGVYHFPHPYGCSQLGDDLSHTQRLLSSLAQHGNAAGVLIIGLGCENNQIDQMQAMIGELDENRIKYMRAQDMEDELEEGLSLISELVEYAETFKRTEVPLSKLKIGLKCGGSDGLSGITANPLAGRIADTITAYGGTALLTEVPEMFGAETILMDRAADEQVFQDITLLINNFKQYFVSHGQEIYENPSPGNKDGGITTLEEKSLGCTQKGGTATVSDVLRYGVRSTKPGLNLIEGPGNDLVSVTALAAAGAHLVLFTTGRGTPFGGPVPTVKIATNSELAKRKKHWIDFNAGALLEGKTMDELHADLLEIIVHLASGVDKTQNERNGFREISIFKDGVIL
ncbi:altronate dehydratase family protein [Paenibacillus lautus]|jgi:altronate hydrolase|uniref:UxaA family hydrolase n=1 Tax=Paenibacillus lautus TaxID=1401 RepID=UPI0026F23408|nr:altronate dehydratase family protein [Paenibacillus lautus]MBY0161080.1 altronate dehydratase [Cytobacillus firmus]MCI1773382.1 altronate dehydratase family protein [Paenibacillus lautus]